MGNPIKFVYPPKKKRFGSSGVYSLHGTLLHKRTADNVAIKMRGEGYLVRVVEERTRWGNYTIYRKKKPSSRR